MFEINENQDRLFETVFYVAGIDEVGRGPLAGPVTAAAVVFDKDCKIEGLKDSKKLSAKKRKILDLEIREKAVDFAVISIPSKEIDELNIYQAAKKAMILAVQDLGVVPEHLLVDAMDLSNLGIDCTSLIKGDQKETSIMAASIIAKEFRDNYMKNLGEKYPEYGFEKHMGYGTKQHTEAILKVGVLEEHRRSFKPVIKAIFSSEGFLVKELKGKTKSEILDFISRVKKMGFISEVGRMSRLINEMLKG